MAQLPPKAPPPNINWPFLPSSATPQNPSWLDDFIEFSASRRSIHRRSASDVVAFLGTHGGHEFDRLDEEQLMAMFSDEATPSVGFASDNDSSNNDKEVAALAGARIDAVKCESSEEELSECKFEAPRSAADPQAESMTDPRRIKRILANRQSAQRSRVRKLQYISELERSVNCLQTEVSVLSPRVAFLDHQRSVLTVGNSALRQRIAALAQDRIFKDAHQEALRKEIERLRQVYEQQSLKKLDSSATTSFTASQLVDCTDKDPKRED